MCRKVISEMCNPIPKTPLYRMLIVFVPPQGVALAKDLAQNAPIEALNAGLIASGKFQEAMKLCNIVCILDCSHYCIVNGTSR